jgi:hypothetical protein
MADRNLDSGKNFGKGMVYLDFGFLTNGTGAIDMTTLTGGGKDAVLSVTRAAAGRITIVLKDKFRYVVRKSAELEDLASGSDDGSYATCGPVTGGGATAISFDVFTRVVAGTKTDFGTGGTGTARRVGVSMVLKNSTVGT